MGNVRPLASYHGDMSKFKRQSQDMNFETDSNSCQHMTATITQASTWTA